MSKSKLKPEDIFFGLQKTNENKKRGLEEAKPEKEAAVEQETEPTRTEAGGGVEELQTPEPTKLVKEEARETAVTEKKKRGPAPNPENKDRVAINVFVSPEVKYSAVAVINEIKMQGLKTRYSMTDFVAEAIEEKVKRMQYELGLD